MALFTTTEEIREFVAINIANDFDNILPYIKQAETKFIKPVIGKALYDEVTAAYQGSSEPEEKMAALIKKIQEPLIYYALYLYAPIASVQISDSGIHISVNENLKTAFDWQVDRLMDSWLQTAHDFIEELLEYLEENKADFSTWTGSDAYTLAHDLFINSAKYFNECYFINNSRRLFAALRPIIKSIEQKYLKGIMGEDLFNAIKEELQSSSEISEDTQALLNIIQPCLAHLTIARALSELPIEIMPNGLFENAVQVISKAKQPAGSSKIANLKDELFADGRAELKQLQEYLDANATAEKYPEYFDSDLYIAPEEGVTRGEFINSEDNSFYFA